MLPTIDQIVRFAGGGFLDVAALGWPAQFQMVVWLCMALVLVSSLNLVGAVPVMGVRPRTAEGLAAIPFAPFMHGSPGHLASNILGALVIGYMMALDHPDRWLWVAVIIALASGAVFWAVGPSTETGGALGASDVLFGLWAYWMAHQWMPLDPSKIAYLGVMAVVFSYWLWQAFAPTDGGRISHLIGALVGVGLAVGGY